MAKTESDAAIPDDIRAMTFEQALSELDEIVRTLETGKVDLEKSITIYSRGTFLKRHCEEKLRSASERIEKIVDGPEGPKTVPANLE
jgi:exodeoxyribonuclease VII small subunit